MERVTWRHTTTMCGIESQRKFAVCPGGLELGLGGEPRGVG